MVRNDLTPKRQASLILCFLAIHLNVGYVQPLNASV
jgi:hypothetical protein